MLTPAVIGACQRRQGAAGGDLVGVIARAGHLDQRDVAVQPHALGHRRDRREAAQAGELARGRGGAGGEARILRMGDHQRAQRAGIGQGAAEHLGVGDHVIAIGEGHRAGVEKKADLGHLAPGPALGQRRHRQHVDRGGLVGAAAHEFQRLGAVDGRRGVGARDHGGHPARGGRQAGRAIALLVPLARLADLDPDIDDPRREALAAAIDGPHGVARNVSRAKQSFQINRFG